MKKIGLVSATILVMVSISCSKNSEGNTGVLAKDESAQVTGDTPSDSTQRYVAEDGSSALVSFKNEGEKKKRSVYAAITRRFRPPRKRKPPREVFTVIMISKLPQNQTV